MSDRRIGKPSPGRLKALLSGRLGAPAPHLLVPPGPGFDAAVLELPDGRVMAVAEDPIFPAIGLPLEIMGWFTVHIGASDVAVTGVQPRYMTYTLLLPTAGPESDAQTIITSIADTALELGISIVGGHTGWYDAVTIPTIGGVTVWGFAERDAWISPGGARDGDRLLMTKGPGVEAAALLAIVYQDRLKGQIAEEQLARLRQRVEQITVVNDALIAFACGGVHAMHDATESGVLGGAYEMADAAGIPVAIDLDAIEVPADIRELARALAFDPWQAISEGTLLAAVEPSSVPRVRDAWRAAGIESYELGYFDRSLGRSSVRRNGATVVLDEPGEDPFWDLYFADLRA
ncbi:MAG: AIR synthase family protein [Oscillochloridaceae bacterium]|nr:AIR synthase family protein [Chloroflexaceae bacterium]MDW8391987.1 AIR synthase family protein [Oscillochloridaceae bacterium]